jgi:tetratricopeptide (TPR) repeat protein
MLMRIAFVAVILAALISAPAVAQAPADGLAAYQALANGDWDLAVFYSTRAIEAGDLPPGDLAAVLAYRGDALRKKGKFAAAVEDYDAGLEIGYSNAFRVRVLNNRGIAFYAIGIFDLAIEDYTEALQLDPTFGAALDNRGTAWVAMGLYEQGIMDYTGVIALAPGNTVAYTNRGRTYLEMQFWQEAIDDFTMALNLGAATALPLFNRAMAFDGLGDQISARADLAIAFVIEPNEVTYQEKYREYGFIP